MAAAPWHGGVRCGMLRYGAVGQVRLCVVRLCRARQGSVRRGMAGPDWHGTAGSGEARQAWSGPARLGLAWSAKASPAKARQARYGAARQVVVRHATERQVGHGTEWLSPVGLGWVPCGSARPGRYGALWSDSARRGCAGLGSVRQVRGGGFSTGKPPLTAPPVTGIAIVVALLVAVLLVAAAVAPR